MKSTLLKYKIGLAVIGFLTLILLVVVLLQAGATKQDAATGKAAEEIATKLNDYVSSKQSIPSSLEAAGIDNAPDTVSYQKLDEQSYKFCLDFKSTSSGFDANAAVAEAITRGAYGSAPNDYGGYTDSAYLIIPTTHHKGQNCQTIKPNLYGGGTFCPLYSTFSDTCSGSSTSSDSLTQ